MALSDTPAPGGILFRLPIIGRIARDIEREPDSVFYLIVGILSLLIIGTVQWGLPVLAMAALAAVPVMFVVLILITLG
ncbi:hypothetical protein SAMN05421774_101771 [Gemmobacter megaterium]|uniref:AcrB/AcrD/AcrF family protein n=1 Tax=Gemmobacter megaterium TaxID=1086013 RepID=A0A1N7KYD6_9RHOB|nr:hypothetical protein [Gemmobacter megaterium]GGE04573.1 hypothetical protein GCM10011345_07560 [Gemmobacter megaterium]SIS66652.1 hypothetical protein SAMN05421774_101771 [Gemmobacter megaterium]